MGIELKPIEPYSRPDESYRAEVAASEGRRAAVDLVIVRTGSTWTVSVGAPYWYADLPKADIEEFAREVRDIFNKAIGDADDVLKLIEADYANE